jgi:hypothetical protein
MPNYTDNNLGTLCELFDTHYKGQHDTHFKWLICYSLAYIFTYEDNVEVILASVDCMED